MSRSDFIGLTDSSETESIINAITGNGNNSDNNTPVFNSQIKEDSNIRYLPTECLENAPNEWNFYRSLNDDKMMELIESIQRNGLLNPIIVWEKQDSTPQEPKYMILSGHNRVKAYKLLYKMTQDDTYKKIASFIKGKDEITEDDAMEIIIDTNWVQRQLTGMEKAKSIIRKYAILQKRFTTRYNDHGEGRSRDIIAKDYKLSGRQIDNYRKLENLIEEIQELVANNQVSITAACEIAKLDKEMQNWIYYNHPDKISLKYTRKIKANMKNDEIKMIFNTSEDIKDINFKISIPIELYNRHETLPKEKLDKLNEKIRNSIIKVMEKYLQNE